MKPFLRQQLERYPIRLGELNFFLQQEGITDDMKKYLALNKEHAEVTTVATRFEQFLKREKDLADAQAMLDDNDMADMHDMAKEEIKDAKADIAQLEDELQGLLLPKTRTMSAMRLWRSAPARVVTNLPCLLVT